MLDNVRKWMGRLRRRKGIEFDGWQKSLKEWRRSSSSEVPEGTIYLGSFAIRYNGKLTGKGFDVYITSNGVIEAVIPRYQEDKVLWKTERRENVIGGDKDD